jgi:hypothetical protein
MRIKYVILRLREAHQNHYEQFGTVKGTFIINKVIFVVGAFVSCYTYYLNLDSSAVHCPT